MGGFFWSPNNPTPLVLLESASLSFSFLNLSLSSLPCGHAVLCNLQVRTHILEAFASGSVKTRDAYIALEHEWMHLETLAYMLAQEQRLSFEKTSASSNNVQSCVSTDSSSDDEMSAKRECLNDHADGRRNGVANGLTNANGNGNGGLNGHTHANGNSHSITDSHTNGDGNSRSSNGHVPLQSASMIQIPAGDITLGIDTDPSKNFAWDNEGPQQSPQHVSSFQMASRPISNAEFYKFAVECRGYEQEEYWKAEDLACLRKATKLCPATWTVQVPSSSFPPPLIPLPSPPFACAPFCAMKCTADNVCSSYTLLIKWLSTEWQDCAAGYHELCSCHVKTCISVSVCVYVSGCWSAVRQQTWQERVAG